MIPNETEFETNLLVKKNTYIKNIDKRSTDHRIVYFNQINNSYSKTT